MAAPCGWTIRDNRLVFDGVRWAPRGTVTADPGRGVKGFALVVVGRQDEDVLRRVLGRPERNARTTSTGTCFRRLDGEVFLLADNRDDGEGDP